MAWETIGGSRNIIAVNSSVELLAGTGVVEGGRGSMMIWNAGGGRLGAGGVSAANRAGLSRSEGVTRAVAKLPSEGSATGLGVGGGARGIGVITVGVGGGARRPVGIGVGIGVGTLLLEATGGGVGVLGLGALVMTTRSSTRR